jgi:hypothetical protein
LRMWRASCTSSPKRRPLHSRVRFPVDGSMPSAAPATDRFFLGAGDLVGCTFCLGALRSLHACPKVGPC